MKGLFTFDGPLYKDKNGIYCNVTLTNEMFNRYFHVVDQLVIAVRTFELDKGYEEMNMKPLDLKNIEVIEVKNLNTPFGLLFEKRKYKSLIREIIKTCDLIFARMPSTTSDVMISEAISLGKPYLVEVGGCAWDAFWNHGFLGKVIAPYMFFNLKYNVAHASFATYVTESFLQKRYPCKGPVCNCSNVYLIPQSETILEERIEKIKNTNLKKIIFGQAVNSIDIKYKGEHIIVELMAELKKRGIQVEYQIVGPGGGDFIIKRARKYGVESNVKLMGVLKKDEIFEWYKKIDIYVQPSKQEGLPRSVIEAMSVGCPAIGSNVAGIPELLSADYLLDLGDKTQMLNTFMKAINYNELKKMAMENFDKAKKYDINIIEERRKAFFESYKNYINQL